MAVASPAGACPNQAPGGNSCTGSEPRFHLSRPRHGAFHLPRARLDWGKLSSAFGPFTSPTSTCFSPSCLRPSNTERIACIWPPEVKRDTSVVSGRCSVPRQHNYLFQAFALVPHVPVCTTFVEQIISRFVLPLTSSKISPPLQH